MINPGPIDRIENYLATATCAALVGIGLSFVVRTVVEVISKIGYEVLDPFNTARARVPGPILPFVGVGAVVGLSLGLFGRTMRSIFSYPLVFVLPYGVLWYYFFSDQRMMVVDRFHEDSPVLTGVILLSAGVVFGLASSLAGRYGSFVRAAVGFTLAAWPALCLVLVPVLGGWLGMPLFAPLLISAGLALAVGGVAIFFHQAALKFEYVPPPGGGSGEWSHGNYEDEGYDYDGSDYGDEGGRSGGYERRGHGDTRGVSEQTRDLIRAYGVLGVDEDASLRVIKMKYKRLVRINHPDKFDADEQGEATERTAELNTAFDLVIEHRGSGRS